MSYEDEKFLKRDPSEPVLAEETLGVYIKVRDEMFRRYGSDNLPKLTDKMGFGMRYWSKKGGRAVQFKVYMTPEGGMKIDFSRDLVQAFLVPLISKEDDKGNLTMHPTNFKLVHDSFRVVVGTNKEDSLMYGFFAVRRTGKEFTADACYTRAMGLLQIILQG